MTANPLRVAGRLSRGAWELRLDARFPPGEVTGVVGPNGAGKTTLLRAVAGLSPLDEGLVDVGGHRWQDDATLLPPSRRRVGVVFQDYRLFPHLDVRDNVAFAARAHGEGRRRARERALHWLERLELDHLARRRPGQLSGGESQRVALARALASDPEVLLLDEPLAALDASARLEVRGFLREHLADFAGPVLLVTHDPLEAMVLADQLVVIEDGSVVQHGATGEVAARPATAYIARLVGLNLYSGTLAGSSIALAGGGSLAVTPVPGTPDGDVLVVLRPSAIGVYAERPTHGSARNVWPARITGMETLADRIRLAVTGEPDALVDVTPAAVAELGLRDGSEIWLSAKATEIDAYPAPPRLRPKA